MVFQKHAYVSFIDTNVYTDQGKASHIQNRLTVAFKRKDGQCEQKHTVIMLENFRTFTQIFRISAEYYSGITYMSFAAFCHLRLFFFKPVCVNWMYQDIAGMHTYIL